MSRSANDNINQRINNEKDLNNLHETAIKTKPSTKESSQNNSLNALIKDDTKPSTKESSQNNSLNALIKDDTKPSTKESSQNNSLNALIKDDTKPSTKESSQNNSLNALIKDDTKPSTKESSQNNSLNALIKDDTKPSTKESSQNNFLNILIKDNYFYLKSILKLIHVRLLFELSSQSKDELKLFEDILQKTKRNIEKKGGEIIFVYLPAIGEYRGQNTKDKYKDKVIQTIKKLNIKTIDIDKEVFSKLENPKDFFSSFTYHYNERGYYLIYERILKELN